MKVLIVYEMVPERTDVFLVDVTRSDYEWMQKCHNHFLNDTRVPKDNEKACMKLSEWLTDKPKAIDEKTVGGKPLDISGYEKFILTGFLL